jgi:alpha-L-rhamnosidase
MKYFLTFSALLFTIFVQAQQLPPVFDAAVRYNNDNRIRKYITPRRVVWQSDNSGQYIKDASNLLKKGIGQAELPQRNLCTLKSDAINKPGIILDFGKELQGGLQLVTGMMKSHDPVRIRVRFGESVSEVMNDIDTVKGATNDHALRDFYVSLPWLGVQEIGNSGFRFVRIDLADANTELHLKEASAIFVYRDIAYKGSFKCNDERLNKIWLTGAYTVHLNMQEYLWDGIKRGRLVWVGDMHPEVMTINSVFGYNDVVPKSLDAAKDQAPLPNWMNGISAYSMWWVLIQKDWYMYQGDKKYLDQQKDYLIKLLNLLMTKVDVNGKETLNGMRFLDWPSSENPKAIHAGLQAMMIMTFDAGAQLCNILNDEATAQKCKATTAKMKQYVPNAANSKQAAALLTLSGQITPAQGNTLLSEDGAKNFSTFYGYYMLKAMAKAGNYKEAMNIMRTYWGAMLDMGATTFWEDFNMDWLENASRIDEPVPVGKKDIHGDCGAYCYKGLRHSLCHGWASGPTSWLTEQVLGVSVIEPGCKVIRIKPNLGDLQWVEGTFPTPYGIVNIKHKKLANGKIETKADGPKQVKIIL